MSRQFLHLSEGPAKLLRSLIWILISFVLAEMSWRLIESPAMRRRRQPAAATPA
ncbi:hypothetical protein [Paracoccus sp. T5]|uniref:hypothetical protein n=1 Tax=Paracoccus sp. T5 TaxID=3402161 RepID=UPI003AE33A6D